MAWSSSSLSEQHVKQSSKYRHEPSPRGETLVHDVSPSFLGKSLASDEGEHDHPWKLQGPDNRPQFDENVQPLQGFSGCSLHHKDQGLKSLMDSTFCPISNGHPSHSFKLVEGLVERGAGFFSSINRTNMKERNTCMSVYSDDPYPCTKNNNYRAQNVKFHSFPIKSDANRPIEKDNTGQKPIKNESIKSQSNIAMNGVEPRMKPGQNISNDYKIITKTNKWNASASAKRPNIDNKVTALPKQNISHHPQRQTRTFPKEDDERNFKPSHFKPDVSEAGVPLTGGSSIESYGFSLRSDSGTSSAEVASEGFATLGFTNGNPSQFAHFPPESYKSGEKSNSGLESHLDMLHLKNKESDHTQKIPVVSESHILSKSISSSAKDQRSFGSTEIHFANFKNFFNCPMPSNTGNSQEGVSLTSTSEHGIKNYSNPPETGHSIRLGKERTFEDEELKVSKPEHFSHGRQIFDEEKYFGTSCPTNANQCLQHPEPGFGSMNPTSGYFSVQSQASHYSQLYPNDTGQFDPNSRSDGFFSSVSSRERETLLSGSNTSHKTMLSPQGPMDSFSTLTSRNIGSPTNKYCLDTVPNKNNYNPQTCSSKSDRMHLEIGERSAMSGQIPTMSKMSGPMPTMFDRMGIMSGQLPTMSSPMSTISGPMSTIFGPMPTMSCPMPTMSGEMPTMSGEMPTVSDEMPTMSGEMPTMSSQMPAMSGPMPTMSGPMPTKSGQVPTLSGPMPTMSGPMPMKSGQVPTMSGPMPTMSGPMPTMSDEMPTMSGPMPTMSGEMPTMSGPMPKISGPMPTMSGPMPTMSRQIPAMSGPMPTMSGPMPTKSGQVPTMSGPMPTMSGPMPTMSGPMPTMSGPMPTMSGPMPTMSGPMPIMSGPMPTMSGPMPTKPGQISTMSGPMPTRLGQISTMSGPTPTMSGPMPRTSCQMPTVSGQMPTMSGPMPTMSGQMPLMSTKSGQMSTMSGPMPTKSCQRPTISGQKPTISGQMMTNPGPCPATLALSTKLNTNPHLALTFDGKESKPFASADASISTTTTKICDDLSSLNKANYCVTVGHMANSLQATSSDKFDGNSLATTSGVAFNDSMTKISMPQRAFPPEVNSCDKLHRLSDSNRDKSNVVNQDPTKDTDYDKYKSATGMNKNHNCLHDEADNVKDSESNDVRSTDYKGPHARLRPTSPDRMRRNRNGMTQNDPRHEGQLRADEADTAALSPYMQTDRNQLCIHDEPGYIHYYDAFLLVHQDDLKPFANSFLIELESWNLKICLKTRDLILTGFEFENMARLISERCNGKVIVVVSINYPESPECQFLTNFARTLDPDARRRSIIPVYIDKGVKNLPKALDGLASIRYNQARRHGWLKEKILGALFS